MKKVCFLPVIIAVLFTAQVTEAKSRYPGKVEQIPGTIAMHRGIGLDIQLEAGVGLVDVHSLNERFFLRHRVGFLCFYEPWFFSIGATVEGLGLPGLAGGVEAEVSNLQFGGWLQGGISVGKEHNFMHIGIGWSVFGVEWQNQVFGTEHANAFLLKLKAPLGILFMGLKMK